MEANAAEGLLNKIKNFLKQNYEPATTISNSNLHLTTVEIFDKLQALYPSDLYTIEDVAEWLHTAGFTFTDFGSMRFEWLIKNL